MVSGNPLENAAERSGLEGGVRRYGLMVLPIQHGRDADMGTLCRVTS